MNQLFNKKNAPHKRRGGLNEFLNGKILIVICFGTKVTIKPHNMKKILGLDLGVTSIGWALIAESKEGAKEILGMGSRIIPLSVDDNNEFSRGNSISKNQNRTAKRTQRKGYDRFQLRRKNLVKFLEAHDMMPDDMQMKASALTLFGLRDKAVKEKVSLKEIGRIMYRLNQKRGYKSSRSDVNLDKKDTEYVAEVKGRHQAIKEQGLTIGQYFFEQLSKDEHYRIKQQVFPREAYMDEFNAICREQKKHHPVLTDEMIGTLRDEIIYYQRRLKSQKGLVSICEFEGSYKKDKKGKEVFIGPKVAHRSAPLFQVCKIWETINTIAIKNKRGETYIIPLEKKQEIFTYLDNNERLSQAELFKMLGLKSSEGWYGNKHIGKGLQGNVCKTQILKHLGEYEHLLQLNLAVENDEKEVYIIDAKTGEVTGQNISKIIAATIEQEPLYQLWHTIYSISDAAECSKALQARFGLPENVSNNLTTIDFTRLSFGNKSAKAMRKILPYLMEGYVYSDACSLAGYNHSNSITTDERLARETKTAIELLKKNSLRQPIVEKILNQLINVVNAIIEKYGAFGKDDEIRIELARELKQSKDERNETFANLNKRERENDIIRKRIEEDYGKFGVRATRNTLIKWHLFHEINNQESKVNATCIYCGQPFGITEALSGNSVDVEHIIPKAKLFDDSQSNKTLVHRKCNEDKKDRTAYDFMVSKGDVALAQYIETVDGLFKSKIIKKGKRDKLLMSEKDIPKDFIDRQLRETQYINKRAKTILEEVCNTVWCTSGNVTEYLRRIWGWNDVLMNLQMPKYKKLGMTEWKEWETENGKQKHKQEVISGWTKRDDHRHHAIDALVIACTQQGFIQRMNTLSAQHNRDEMFTEVSRQSTEFKERLSLLDKYMIAHRPFTTKHVEEVADTILIAFKAGKRVAAISKYKAKGKNESTGVIVPRGALSEESVYGKIKGIEKNKPVKYLFEHPELVFKPYIKALVEERLAQFGNNAKSALASLKKEPVYLDKEKTTLLEYGTCYKEEIVIKYPLESLKVKDADFIVDEKIKQIVKERLAAFGNKEKEAFKDLEKNPVWFDEARKIPIKTVRCFTGLTAVEPVKKDANGKDIGFVKPGNNHHIAIYKDGSGKKQEHLCSFWHAVERKKYKIPAIIERPKAVWTEIIEEQNEYPQDFLNKLPDDMWTFELSLQQNEMFILGLSKEEAESAIKENNKKLLSQYLYRVQKLSSSDYVFRHHLETSVSKDADKEKENAKRQAKRYHHIQSIDALYKLNPMKVRVSNLGEITEGKW